MTMLDAIRFWRIPTTTIKVLVGIACGLSGCTGPLLTLHDVVYLPDHETVLVAQLEYDSLIGMRDAIEGKRIEFSVGGETVGAARSNDEGCAQVTRLIDNDAMANTVEATARVDGRRLQAHRPVFRWDPDKVIIVVDVDNTICVPDRDDLLFDDFDKESQPIPGSQRVLTELSADFHILYLTARPIFLLEETRDWLARNGYPESPLITAPSIVDMITAADTKTNILLDRQAHWPNLLIGIGDQASDAVAYANTHMLGIILDATKQVEQKDNTLVVEDWSKIESIFESHADVLKARDRLSNLIKRGLAEVLTREDPILVSNTNDAGSGGNSELILESAY